MVQAGNKVTAFTFLFAICGSCGQAFAGDLYWDPNGTGSGVGGDGEWNLSDASWATDGSGGGPHSIWDNTALHTAFINGSGTLTVAEPITVNAIMFDFSAGNPTLTGGTITFAGASPLVETTFINSVTIDSVIAGTDGLTFSGGSAAGGFHLSAANTITGGINLGMDALVYADGTNDVFNGANNVVWIRNYGRAGALIINNANAFGGDTDASRLVMDDGAEIRIGSADLVHDVTATGGSISIQEGFTTGPQPQAAWTGRLVLQADTTLLFDRSDRDTIYHGPLTDTGANQLSLRVDSPYNGHLILAGDSNAEAEAYTGNTAVVDALLRLDHAGAITGGLGAASSHGATGSNQRSSLVEFSGAADGTAGVIGLTALSGGFYRNITTETDAFLDDNATPGNVDDDNYVHGVRWAGSGGFAAWDGTQEVNLGGAGATVTWGAGGFVADAHRLTFGDAQADGTVDFQNGIDFGASQRTIEVRRGVADVDAILSGLLVGTGGLTVEGDGVLALTADNTFTGSTIVNGGVLQLGNGGTTGDLDSTVLTLNAGATLAFDRSDALALDAAITGGGTLRQRGTNTTTLTAGGDIGNVRVESGTLTVAGTASITGAATAVVDTGATLIVDGTYSGTTGADTMTIAGIVSGAGTVGLLDGDDTLTLQGGADLSGFVGSVDGGIGSDTLALDVATTLTLAAADITNFEILNKDNTGTATLNGAHTYTNANLNGGVLDVIDTLETPTIDLGDGATLNVDGTVQATGATQTAITGSADANTVMVNAGGTLLATGNLGDGVDTLDVAGTLDTGGGAFDLGGGDDEFVLHDGTTINGTVDGGAGIDTHVYDLDLSADLGALGNFEGLTKRGSGTLNVIGPGSSNLATVTVEGGTLNVGAAGSIVDVTATTVDAGATLNVDGGHAGTAGADTMSMAGVLSGNGSIDFGAGEDALTVEAGSDLSAFTGTVDGGDDADTLTFNDQAVTMGESTGTGSLKIAVSPVDLRNWEVVELAGSSTLTQHEALDLGANGLLSIGSDATWLPGSTTLTGSVANAGRIELGMNRVAISGDYASTGDTGVIAVAVSPGEGTAGGLDIDGDVTGTSTIAFSSDGSLLATPAEIVVVNSPNDDAGTPGRFVAEDTDDEGIVRIDGSVIAWNFEQKDDGSWYLNEAKFDDGSVGGGNGDGVSLLPEVPGYSQTATLTKLAINDLQGAAFDRNTELRKCFHAARADADRNANSHCGRAWTQAPVRRIEMQRDDGFLLDGELTGASFGADTLRRRDDGAIVFGAFMLFQQGNFDAQFSQQPTDGSRVDFSTRQVGIYGGVLWNAGAYLDYSASFGRQQSTVNASGFNQVLTGYTGSASARLGHLVTPTAHWSFDPYVGVMASKTDWQDIRDSANRDVSVSDDPWVVGKLGLRSQWSAGTGGWFSLWLDLDASQSLSGGESGAEFGAGGASAGFDGAELGSWANARLGAAMKLGRHAELQAAVMASESFDKDDYTEEQAYLGLRIEW